MRRHVRLQRALVGAEPGVAVDAEQRDAWIRHEIGSERREVPRQLTEQRDHRTADMLLVVRLPRAEPLAVVVPLQRAQERERLLRERRSHYARTCLAAANRSCICRVRCGTMPSMRSTSISCAR